MKPAQSHIALAIGELEAERTHLAARLGKVEEAIATMRGLFHLPGVVKAPGPLPREKSPRKGVSGLSVDAIRSALQKGPLPPGDLAKQLGVPRHRLRVTVAELQQDGVLSLTGSTTNRQIALAGSPAKEAP